MKPARAVGVDKDPKDRPGVPMEGKPHLLPGAHWDEPQRQPVRSKVFRRVGLEKITPVFGTAQPPRGLSGMLREAAYRIPEHRASHWGILLIADRVDVVEGALEDLTKHKTLVKIAAVSILGAATIAALMSGRRRRKS